MDIIANPIYDTAFKALFEKKRNAKFFISTLLEEVVIEVEPNPQGRALYGKGKHYPSLSRMYFTAVTHTKEGDTRHIDIEMQKVGMISDIVPHLRSDPANSCANEEQTKPLTTIYVLGCTLPGIDTACLKVGRDCIDLINQQPLKDSTRFVNGLAPDSYIVQTPLIKPRYRNRLDQLLNLFEQDHFLANNDSSVKAFDAEKVELDPEVKDMLAILKFVAADKEMRKKLDEELYYQKFVRNTFGEIDREIAEKEKKIVEADRELAEKDRIIAEMQAALAEMQNHRDPRP